MTKPPKPTNLQRNEVLLIIAETDTTSVVQGEGGFLLFRQWILESIKGEEIWRIKDEFMLGSQGRNPLVALLATDPKAEIWRGEVVAEAAAPFKNGHESRWITWYGPTTLEAAKSWVESQVSDLLKIGERLSQAFVGMPGDEITYELDPSTWGSFAPRWHTWED